MRGWIRLYVAAFAALTVSDIASTLWATDAGAKEFNAALSTGDGLLHVERMIAINAAYLAFSTGMLAWALSRRDRIDPLYLARPERAMFNFFYLNPFSKKIVPKSAFHFIALAPAVLAMKAFATLNNSLIAANAPDLVTPLATTIHGLGAGGATFWIVVVVLFFPIWWAALCVTARALTSADASPRVALTAG